MPDVTRSDSQRSDSSQRPRVSFNRDVHIKRIGNPGGSRVVGALAGDGEGHLVPLSVRRERPAKLSRRQLTKEAEKILNQAESVQCTVDNYGSLPRTKNKSQPSGHTFNSLDRSRSRKKKHILATNDDLRSDHNTGRRNSYPEHTVRTSSSSPERTSRKTSSLDRPKNRALGRSVSDAGRKVEKKPIFPLFATLDRLRGKRKTTPVLESSKSDIGTSLPKNHHVRRTRNNEVAESKTPILPLKETLQIPNRKKKQLSPIIELSPKEDTHIPFEFTPKILISPSTPVTYHTKHETLTPNAVSPISNGRRGSYEITEISQGDGRNGKAINGTVFFQRDENTRGYDGLKEKKEGLRSNPTERSVPFISEDRKSVGRVDRLVRKLTEEGVGKRRSPPKVLSPLVEPGDALQHNLNQPFSYTAGVPPTGPTSPTTAGDQVIYAEVLVTGPNKQTVHTAIEPGLLDTDQTDLRSGSLLDREPEANWNGHYEPVKNRNGNASADYDFREPVTEHTSGRERIIEIDMDRGRLDFEDDLLPEERIISMIRAKSNPVLQDDYSGYRVHRTERIYKVEGVEPSGRGRGDGMDFSKRRGSGTVDDDRGVRSNNRYEETMGTTKQTDRTFSRNDVISNDLSYRRNLLESRVENQRKLQSNSPEFKGDKFLKMDESRRDFLHSLIDDKDRYFESRIATENTHLMRNKDVFSDSGVELSDYRKDARDITAMNRRNLAEKSTMAKLPNRSKSSLDFRKEEERTQKKRLQRSDSNFTSTKLVQDQKKKSEVIPTSTTLVKNYSKKEDPPKLTKKALEKTKKKEKISTMEKVKQLMFGSKEAKKKKLKKEEEDLLKRYTEYRGSDLEPSVTSSPVLQRRRRTSSSEIEEPTDPELEYYGSRQRLATPSPQPSDHNRHNRKKEPADDRNNWFKSLDRLTRRNKQNKANKNKYEQQVDESGNDDDQIGSLHSFNGRNNKHLRFFGDTDQESEIERGRKSDNLQVPGQRQRKQKLILPESSAESTTEGDSSQHSQKSVVYLHAATVGDIPGSRKLHRSVMGGGRRAMSREELSSNGSNGFQPHTRTISRSVSVLAPWRPRHYRDEINYDDVGKPPRPPNGKNKQMKLKETVQKKPSSHRTSDESRKSRDNLASDQSKYKRSSRDNLLRSRENLLRSRDDLQKGRMKSKDKLVFTGKSLYGSRDNIDILRSGSDNRRDLSGERGERKQYRHEGSSTIGRRKKGTDERNGEGRKDRERGKDLLRSTSIPKDTKLTSGWFKSNKK